MDKLEQLKKLEAEMADDANLPLRESNLVFGEGDINCRVMFIGEAPGFYEDQLKRPFVGRAGQLLNQLIEGIGWRREEVYITNVLKRRPPENRDPLPAEIGAYRPYLIRQIEIIEPKIIIALGRFSMNYFLPVAKISRDQGKVFRWGTPRPGSGQEGEKGAEKGRFIVPMFHPAAALRSTSVLEELEASFRKLPDILEKCEAMVQEPPPVKSKPSTTVSQQALF